MAKKRTLKPKITPPPPQTSLEEIPVDPITPRPNRTQVWIWGVVILIGLIVVASTAFAYWYIEKFSRLAGLTSSQTMQTVRQGVADNPFNRQASYNILFLGLDKAGQQRQNSRLTDTILLINLNQSGKVSLIPIPRDLWIDSLKTKINALYYYGEQNPDITGPGLVKKTLEEISGQIIDYTIIADMDSVKTIIDSIGGIVVTVDQAFRDDQFPRDDVAPDALPIESRYKSITFDAGVQTMDGSRALEFIRSRKSVDEAENTDQARSARQQKVITAIAQKLAAKESWLQPELYGTMYSVWHQTIETDIPDHILIGMAAHFVQQSPSLSVISLPVKSATTEGIIYNPPIRKYNQWVYEPVDATWIQFQQFFTQAL